MDKVKGRWTSGKWTERAVVHGQDLTAFTLEFSRNTKIK